MADQTNKTDIVLGVILMGTTGILIGFFWDSYVLIAVAGTLGSIIGGFVGWLGGRRYMAIILAGGVIGFLLGR